jgi:hypothetical protein
MSVKKEWDGGIRELLATIYRTMPGDKEAFLQFARRICGNDLVDDIKAECDKKFRHVDGKDSLKRIEERLDAVLSQTSKSMLVKVEPDEVSTREACLRLSISAKTLRKLVRAGRLARRNTSPPGSGKPNYRYRIVDIDRLKSQGYHKVARPQEPRTSRPKVRRRKPEPQTYEHLDL